jgi:hypothetical protein
MASRASVELPKSQDDWILFMEQKENQLHLAAKFGQSLLHENQLLLEKISFLERHLEAHKQESELLTATSTQNQLDESFGVFDDSSDEDEPNSPHPNDFDDTVSDSALTPKIERLKKLTKKWKGRSINFQKQFLESEKMRFELLDQYDDVKKEIGNRYT